MESGRYTSFSVVWEVSIAPKNSITGVKKGVFSEENQNTASNGEKTVHTTIQDDSDGNEPFYGFHTDPNGDNTIETSNLGYNASTENNDTYGK
ncbi:hypothetical protein PR048_015951 [Dryococelus australis]|uniref:Uncharacterized protein n=1 Tax=Dryococelus australis TaxID=614101 RepID=A0ABQ9HIQ3_9NEOP|nr:hypothetical protein PR048_015951 [Dryococelus australis]